ALAATPQRNLCPGGRYAGYRHRRDVGAPLGRPNPQTGPLSRQRPVQPRALGEQPGPALGRARPGRHGAVDPATVGVALPVSADPPPWLSPHLGIRHKTLGLRARQVVSLLRRWLPGVPIKLLGDQAYSILELELHGVRQQITLIAPFRLDSV